MKLEFFDGTTWNSVVTSVGITGSTGLSVLNSPVTTSGTITLTLGVELQALSSLNTTGILVRKGTSSYAPVTITGTSGQINVTNGDGVGGNPVISLPPLAPSLLQGYPSNSSYVLKGDGTWSAPSVPANIPASNLAGYPNNAASYLRGDGVWSTTLNVLVPPNKISGYPANINYTLRGDSSWGLIFGAQINGYPNNAGYVFCGDNNWRPIPQAITGYPNDPAKVLKGDGTWNYIQYVPLSSLQGYNNAWNYVPCGDSNWRTIAEATPGGSFPLNRLGGYPTDWRYIPCGDGNWRPTAQTIEGYPNDPAKVLKGDGTWNYIQYVPLSSLQGYNNAWNYVPCGDSNWRTIADATPGGSFPLNRLGGYPTDWRYIPCGDGNWRPTAQTIEGYPNDPAKVLKGDGTWNYIQYVPLSSLQGYPNNSAYYLRGDGAWAIGSGGGGGGASGTVTSITAGTGLTGGTITTSGTISLGTVPIQNLAGYPTNSTYFLRGDGIWTTPPASSIDINTGTTGQLNISRLNGYPTHTSYFLRGDGTWTDPLIKTVNSSSGKSIILNNTNTSAIETGLCFQKNGVEGLSLAFSSTTNLVTLISNAGGVTIDGRAGSIFLSSSNNINIEGDSISFRSGGFAQFVIDSTGFLNLRNNRITNSSSPVNDSDLTNKLYVDTRPVANLNGYTLMPAVGNAYTNHLILKHSGSSTSNQSGIGAGPYSAVLYGQGTDGRIAEFFYGSTRQAYISTNGTYYDVSDKNQKHSLRKKEGKNYLKRILDLPVYSYCMKREDMNSHQANQVSIGVMYQDVEKIFNGSALSKPKMHEKFLCQDKNCLFCHPEPKGVCYADLFLYHILAFKDFYEQEYVPLKKRVEEWEQIRHLH